MDHSEALQLMATEKYLLDEFPPEVREQFEEHFFSCPECAIDVRMAAAFIENSKKVLSTPAILQMPVAPPKPERFSWLRPIFALPALAILLAVIGYQALVVYPKQSNTIANLQKPQVLTAVYLSNGAARGETRPLVTAEADQPFILFVDIPSDNRFKSYSAELLNSAGVKVWDLNIASDAVDSAKGTLPIRIPAAGSPSGEYSLVLRGLDANSTEGPEISRYIFELQVR